MVEVLTAGRVKAGQPDGLSILAIGPGGR